MALVPSILFAQTAGYQASEHDITVIPETTDTSGIHRNLLDNSPTTYHIPGAPRFVIVGKNRKFYLGIGGQARGTAIFDWGNPINNPDVFATSAIPMQQDEGNGGRLQFSARQSSIYLNFVAMPDNPNKIGAFFSANLLGNGNNYAFNVQYAYLRYRGITAGYDYTLFGDMGAAIQTIDYEGPNSFTAFPNGVIDYRHNFGKFGVGIGLENPVASYTNSATTKTVSQRVPDIPAYVQYSWKTGSWIRFSAILRNMTYRDLSASKNRTATGWGIKMSGSVAMAPWVKGLFQVAYGRGMTSYFQDLYTGGMDMTPSATKAGHLDLVKAWGGYAGLQFNITPKLTSNVAYSHLRTYADAYTFADNPWGDQYSYGQYAVANVFYNFNSFLSWGLEYIWGRRVNMNGCQAHDNRLQTMLQVSF